MRTFALLLIFANACFFFWSRYIDVPEAEPASDEIVAAKPAPRLLLTKEQTPEALNKLKVAAAELTCLSVGPFGSDSELQEISRRLHDAGFDAAPRVQQGEVFAGYWVSLPGMATRADAEQALKRLHAADITDAYILPDDNSLNVLSLGLFTDQARAEARRDAISKLGFQPVLQNRMRPGEIRWLDVTLQEPGQLIDPALLQADTGGITRLETTACPPAGSAVFEAKALR